MEDADSGQPKGKKKKTEKGNEKRWWYQKYSSLKFLHFWGKKTYFAG